MRAATPAKAAASGRRLDQGMAVVATVAGCKLLLHLLTASNYGYFRDELYYLACAEHLDWGYVDMPPLLPVLTAGIRALLGDSLFAIHVLPALSGALKVVLAGLIARELGGRTFAQALAALAVVAAPIYLTMDAMLTMNTFEPLFWVGCAYVLVRVIRTGNARLWLWFGVLAGLGLVNKHSMAFFGLGVAAGLLLTSQRRLLRDRWFWIGGLVAFAIFLPNLVWMIRHDFPHLEMLENIRRSGRDVSVSPGAFLLQQIVLLNPLAFPIWLAGLAHFMVRRDGRPFRLLGWAYLTTLVALLLVNGRVYYLAPAYPMLLAGGAVAIEHWCARRGQHWLRPSYAALLIATGAVFVPVAVPVLPVESYIRYERALGLRPPRIETRKLGPLPQLFADRFGWPEMARTVARVYHSLPAQEQRKAAIFAKNSGEAGAIDLFGPKLGLPKAISGHVNYFYWGPGDYTGEIMIALGGGREALEARFDSVVEAGVVEHPYAMPFENFEVYLCRGPRQPLKEMWPQLKRWTGAASAE